MIRHTTLVVAAVVVLALSAMTTGASARHVGHWHHAWHGGVIAPALIGLAAAPFIWGPPAYAYAYGYGCYVRHERILTPWGWRWRPVEECY
jgi:hypothetical protein